MIAVIQPILLLPASGIDVQGRNDLYGLATQVLRPLEEFWERNGQLALLRTPTIETADFDLVDAYPWDNLQDYFIRQGRAVTESEHVLVFLAGWTHPRWAGWGGNGIALVGDYFFQLARGGDSFDAAAGLAAHELGHTFRGAGHKAIDLTPPDIMGAWWHGATRCIAAESHATVLGVQSIQGCERPA